MLNAYAADRSLAVYCLLINGLTFDAEIVLRSFYETIAKSLLFATASSERRENLLVEYWEILPAVHDVKGVGKAEIAEKLARRYGRQDDERVFASLRNDALFTVKHSANRSARKVVESRWLFSNIIRALSRGSDDHTRIACIESLFHVYGMSSHVAHANPKAFDLLEDRMLRVDDRLSLEVALDDQSLMADALREAFERMNELTKPYQESFSRSQDDFYEYWSSVGN